MPNIIETIDRLFDENKPKEAEAFMLQELALAKSEDRREDQLLLLNELIGYYRQTSEKEELIDVINQSINLAKTMGIEGSISYATTILNAANGYRSIGDLEKSKDLYLEVESLYDEFVKSGQLAKNDMLIAGLYNNLSLLYQEFSDFKSAEEYQLKALDISLFNNAGFEIAVSNANLANTYLLSNNYEKVEYYAIKAITLFEQRGLFDPHYCAALSALGNCYYGQGKYSKARDYFSKACKIVESTFGKNSQYYRLEESLKMSEKMLGDDESEVKSEINGMQLSYKYYEEYGKAMIYSKFPEYVDKIAVGLVGEGSDCFMYDDSISRDHDFGPDFCMWLDDETYAEIGQQLKEEYEKLPKEFLGVRANTTAMGSNRRGVFKISDFYMKFLGTDEYEKIDYANIPDYSLAACTNGRVFVDVNGKFSELREKLLAGYRADIRLKKIAEDVALFSQTGQYNYSRLINRSDELSAQIMLGDFFRVAMRLYHHILNVYPPHDKWLLKSTSLLEGGSEIVMALEAINKADNPEEVCELIEKLASHYSKILYDNGDISDVDNYLDHHVSELLFKSSVVMLSKDELVERIARLEFEAFDKVKNEGGRASCQNNWPTFSIMRKSQYLTWNESMLLQYYYDFTREYEQGHNLITEKYGRMMESTAPEKYDEIKDNFPDLSPEKKSVIEQIVNIQMQMAEEFAKEYPEVAGNARNLHTSEDSMFDTSYETYLRGELGTYSDKMLQLYGQFVVGIVKNGGNIARMTIENTAKLYGFDSLEAFEKAAK